MLVKFYAGKGRNRRLLYETDMPHAPRVGETVEFPSSRSEEVTSVAYLLGDTGIATTTAIVQVTGT